MEGMTATSSSSAVAGHPSLRAMQLIDGAQAIAGDLPRPPPRSSRCRWRPASRSAPASIASAPCCACASALGGARRDARTGPHDRRRLRHRARADRARRARIRGDLAVVWIDAHPDLNTPESSPSGAFSGMVLRAVLGDGADGLALDEATRVAPSGSCSAGSARSTTRSAGSSTSTASPCSPSKTSPTRRWSSPRSRTPAHRRCSCTSTSTCSTPRRWPGSPTRCRSASTPPTLAALLRAVAARFPLAGAAIAGFAPNSPEAADDDLPTILRLVAALTSGNGSVPAAGDAASSARSE